MRKIKYLILLVWVGCVLPVSAHSPKAAELITPVKLTAGKTDTLMIGDLFFAETYALTVAVHENITAAYDAATQQLRLTPAADFEGMTLLHARNGDQPLAIPVTVSKEITRTFRFRPAQTPQHITLFGAFNGWNRNQLFMKDPDGDGEYEITIPIAPGRYEYKFFVDGEEILDRSNPDSISNPFGSYNSVLTVAPRHTDRLYLHILGKRVEKEIAVVEFYYEHENPPAPLNAANIIALLDNQPLPAGQIAIDGQRITVTFPQNEPLAAKTLRIAVTQGGQTTSIQTVRLHALQPQASHAPFFWQDAVLYSLMVDRFNDGDPQNNRPVDHPELLPPANFQGGDLQGIINKIRYGYFDSLGVNALWISPVIQNTPKAHKEYPPPHRYFSGYHGYWPIHPEKVDERFGDMKLFKKLVRTAHLQGMRVLLDFVSNHTHEDHPFFRQHRDWFGTYELPDGRKNIRIWDEYRLTTWFEPFLPSFDYLGSPAALEAMTDNAVWWLRETGIDGFRQDAVKHVPNEFWRLLTRKIKQQVQPERDRPVYQIGETFGGYELVSSYVNNGQLDAQFNFNLYFTARQVFLDTSASFKIVAEELGKTHEVYGMSHLMGNLIDSHDQVRYMAFADGDLRFDTPDAAEVGWTNPPQVDDPQSYQKARLYLAFVMTIPGVPTLYYGDEIGMTGAADPDNRRMMRFGNQLNAHEREMLAKTRELTRLRRGLSALRHGDFLPLFADENLFIYLRSDVNQRVLVALNKSASAVSHSVQLPEIYDISAAKDALSGDEISVENQSLNIELPAYGYRVLVLQ